MARPRAEDRIVWFPSRKTWYVCWRDEHDQPHTSATGLGKAQEAEAQAVLSSLQGQVAEARAALQARPAELFCNMDPATETLSSRWDRWVAAREAAGQPLDRCYLGYFDRCVRKQLGFMAYRAITTADVKHLVFLPLQRPQAGLQCAQLRGDRTPEGLAQLVAAMAAWREDGAAVVLPSMEPRARELAAQLGGLQARTILTWLTGMRPAPAARRAALAAALGEPELAEGAWDVCKAGRGLGALLVRPFRGEQVALPGAVRAAAAAHVERLVAQRAGGEQRAALRSGRQGLASFLGMGNTTLLRLAAGDSGGMSLERAERLAAALGLPLDAVPHWEKPQGLAPRTIGLLHGILHAAFGAWAEDGEIARNPLAFKRARVGGVDVDADPDRRSSGTMRALTLEEQRALVFDLASPLHHRFTVACCCMAGMRFADVAQLRWCNWHPEYEPLPGWHLTRTKGWEKTDMSRPAPAVPALQRIVEAYRARWQELVGREPRPEDPVLITGVAADGTFRRYDRDAAYLGLNRQLRRLGFERRGLHAQRRGYSATARQVPGADVFVADLVCHVQGAARMMERYGGFPYEAVCAELLKKTWQEPGPALRLVQGGAASVELPEADAELVAVAQEGIAAQSLHAVMGFWGAGTQSGGFTAEACVGPAARVDAPMSRGYIQRHVELPRAAP